MAAAAAAIFADDNYVFWEVSNTPTTLSKIRWGYGEDFLSKNFCMVKIWIYICWVSDKSVARDISMARAAVAAVSTQYTDFTYIFFL